MGGIKLNNGVNNRGNIPAIMANSLANRPVAANTDLLFVDTSTPAIYYDNGSWITITQNQDLSGYVQKWETWKNVFQIETPDNNTHVFDYGYFFDDNLGNNLVVNPYEIQGIFNTNSFTLSKDELLVNNTNGAFQLNKTNLNIYDSVNFWFAQMSNDTGITMYNAFGGVNLNTTEFSLGNSKIFNNGIFQGVEGNFINNVQVSNTFISGTSVFTNTLIADNFSTTANLLSYNPNANDTVFFIDENNFRYRNAATNEYFDYTDGTGLYINFANERFVVRNDGFNFLNNSGSGLSYNDENSFVINYQTYGNASISNTFTDGIQLFLTNVSGSDYFYVNVDSAGSSLLFSGTITTPIVQATNKLILSQLAYTNASTAPINTTTPVTWVLVTIGGSSYRMPLYQ